MDKRDRVATEVVDSERSYVASLENVVQLYIRPLKALEKMGTSMVPNNLMGKAGDKDKDLSEGAPLSAAKIKVLFGDLEILLGCNQKFLQDLEVRLEDWKFPDSKKCIGDLFISFAPYFKMYSRYASQHEASSSLLAKLMEKKKYFRFQQFCKEVELSPNSGNETLASFLIMPIQRVPRYQLLLKELSKRTPEEHPDYADIMQALGLVGTSAAHINDAISRKINQDTIMQLQMKFAFNPEFVSPGREFIRQAELWHCGGNGNKRYTFFLFNNMLAYASKLAWKFKLQHKLPIDASFQVHDLDPLPDHPHRFTIMSSQESFVVYTDDQDVKNAWLADLRSCVDNVHTKLQQRALRPSSGTVAPVRRPTSSSSAPQCVLCHKPFKLFRRKHSCKKCHRIVCQDCCFAEKPIRICTRCAPSPESTPTPTPATIVIHPRSDSEHSLSQSTDDGVWAGMCCSDC